MGRLVRKMKSQTHKGRGMPSAKWTVLSFIHLVEMHAQAPASVPLCTVLVLGVVVALWMVGT